METNKYNLEDYLYYVKNGEVRGFVVAEVIKTRRGWAYSDGLSVIESEENVSLTQPDIEDTLQKFINLLESSEDKRHVNLSKGSFLYLAKKAGYKVKTNV